MVVILCLSSTAYTPVPESKSSRRHCACVHTKSYENGILLLERVVINKTPIAKRLYKLFQTSLQDKYLYTS